MNASLESFGDNYGEARQRFEAAAKSAGAAFHRYRHDDPGLSCDVAVIGPANAPRRLAMIAGTHGAEGFAGSAVMVDWLRRGQRPEDMASCIATHTLSHTRVLPTWLKPQTQPGIM